MPDGTQIARSQIRSQAAISTIYDTAHSFDAGRAGYDGPTAPEEGGFRVVFDGRHSIPSVVLNGSDGEITVTGYEAIRELANALLDAERKAARMTPKAA